VLGAFGFRPSYAEVLRCQAEGLFRDLHGLVTGRAGPAGHAAVVPEQIGPERVSMS